MSEALEVEEGAQALPPTISPEKDHVLAFPDTSWHIYASCRSSDLRLFFGDGKQGGSKERGKTKQEAIAICKGCPVRIKCLKYAVLNDVEYGIWGGYDMRLLKSSGRKKLAQSIKQ